MNGTVEFLAEVSASVMCANCGYDLTVNRVAIEDETRRFGGNAIISVQPCPDCLKEAREEGRLEE